MMWWKMKAGGQKRWKMRGSMGNIILLDVNIVSPVINS